MEQMRCKDCIFLDTHDADEDEGFCRRFPPDEQGLFPNMFDISENWCGEFKRK